jgi:hypothetical protein
MAGRLGAMVFRRNRRHMGSNCRRVEETFGTVVIIIAVVAGIVAAAAYVGSGRLYEGIGKGAFSLDQPDRPKGPQPGTAADDAEAEAETRQMLEAKSALRVARGEPPLDVDAEYAALTRPSAGGRDEALREEVRQLVIASNERRARRGEPPLDVETEIDRQLRDLGA